MLVSAAIGGCGSSNRTYPLCEQGTASLIARTVDGAATIAAVTTTGNCQVTAVCVPSTTTPCATVSIVGYGATTCTATFVSVDGRSISATASVTANGPSYQCRDGSGMIHTAGYSHFEPASIDVDFSAAGPGDGGAG